MRRFRVFYFDEDKCLTSNTLCLMREYVSHLEKYFYRFSNLNTDSIFPEYFETPAAALDWLDETFGEGYWEGI